MLHRRPLYLVAALTMLLIAACQSAAPATPTPAPLTDEQLNAAAEIFETTWTVQEFFGADGPIAPIEGTYPSINFMTDRFDGYTGCNYFVGTYRTTADQHVELDPPAVTKAVCDSEELTQQESAFLTILITADAFAYDNETIKLSGDDRELMTLQPLEPVPFEGTTWHYSFYQGQSPQWQPALPDTVVTSVFDGGVISGNTGCNDYSGAYTIDGDVISITDLVATDNTCTEPADIMDQEERYLSALETATNIKISARTIELYDPERPIMLFSAN